MTATRRVMAHFMREPEEAVARPHLPSAANGQVPRGRHAISCFIAALTPLLCLVAAWSAAERNPRGGGVAGNSADDKKVIKVDHLAVTPLVASEVVLRDGEEFTIVVLNTVPDMFKFELQSATRAPAPGRTAAALNRQEQKQLTRQDLTRQVMSGVHHKQYGGYLLRVTSLTDGPVDVDDNGTARKLVDFVLMLGVTTSSWEIETAGAFTASGLTDPQFYVDQQDYVRQNKKAQDAVKLGVGAFVHLYHSRHPEYALSFGIAINDSQRIAYYLGPSLRLGGKAFITAGVAAGSVSRLPNGVVLNQKVSDQSALTTLPTRTSWSAFFGFSYTFLGGAEQLKKPFEGPTPASVPQASDGNAAGAGPLPPPGDEGNPKATKKHCCGDALEPGP